MVEEMQRQSAGVYDLGRGCGVEGSNIARKCERVTTRHRVAWELTMSGARQLDHATVRNRWGLGSGYLWSP